MKRWLLNIASTLSLLLFAATVAAAIRSYWVPEGWRFKPQPCSPLPGSGKDNWQVHRWLGSQSGRLALLQKEIPEPRSLHPRPPEPFGYRRGGQVVDFFPAFDSDGVTGQTYWTLPGFTFGQYPSQIIANNQTLIGTRLISISWWLLALPFLPLPLFWSWRQCLRLRRAHRLRHNLCPTCGYDLRASTDRCPECGTLIPTQKIGECTL